MRTKRAQVLAFVLVALIELLQHAPVLAGGRWCPQC